MRRAGVPARNRGGHFTEWKQRRVEDEHCPSRHQPQAREPEWRPAKRLHVLLLSGKGGRHAATEVLQQRNSDDKRDDKG
jgi:hypothetical protein